MRELLTRRGLDTFCLNDVVDDQAPRTSTGPSSSCASSSGCYRASPLERAPEEIPQPVPGSDVSEESA